MSYHPAIKHRHYNTMNIGVLLLQTIGWVSIISLYHNVENIFLKVALVLFFCLMMQGVFSFMHECFHGRAHSKKKMNWLLGFWSSAMFGTAFTLFERNHQGHHVRNRTRPELVDYIYPDESPVKKISLYYIAIVGGIWIAGLIAPFICFLIPYRLKKLLVIDAQDNTYSEAFNQFSAKFWWLMRLETVLAVLFWLAAFKIFAWRLEVLLVFYAAFAFSWSSLQWVYHVRTPIHTIEGAYNLRAPWLIRVLFLNFNYNLSHHRDKDIPWQELYSGSNQQETQPLLYRYIRIFLPPQPLPEDISTIKKVYF